MSYNDILRDQRRQKKKSEESFDLLVTLFVRIPLVIIGWPLLKIFGKKKKK